MAKLEIEPVKQVIEQLEQVFDSHQFIQKFSADFESEYIDLLYQSHSFEETHKQIGRYLSKYSEELGIDKNGKVKSKNFRGNENEIESWIKVSK